MVHRKGHEAASGLNAGASLVIEEEIARHALAAGREHSLDLVQVVLDVVGHHVREDRGQDDEVEGAIGEREDVLRRGDATVGIVGAADDIGAMKRKVRQPSGDRSLTPGDGFRMDLDPVVGATEVVLQSQRERADAGSDVEDPVMRLQASTHELGVLGRRRVLHDRRIPGAVVVDAKMRRWQERVTPLVDDAIHRRRKAIQSSSRPAREPFPQGPSQKGLLRRFTGFMGFRGSSGSSSVGSTGSVGSRVNRLNLLEPLELEPLEPS